VTPRGKQDPKLQPARENAGGWVGSRSRLNKIRDFDILGRRSKKDRPNQFHKEKSRANQPGFVVLETVFPFVL